MANFIHPTAIIGDNVILGDNNYIGAYCIIGDPAEHKKYWEYEEQIKDYGTLKIIQRGQIKRGLVTIGNNNIVTGLVTIDAGTEAITTIGDNCFIKKNPAASNVVGFFLFKMHDCNKLVSDGFCLI